MVRTNSISPLKDGYGYDFATEKPVDMTKPEEAVRQQYERILHEEYGYDRARMDIEVYIHRGSAGPSPTRRGKRGKDRADLVVYATANPLKRDQHRDILGIIETKASTRRTGLRQLMSYMSASSSIWGVWTNGEDIAYLYKDPKTGQIMPDFIFDIPRSGETPEEMGRFSKKDLIPAKHLKVIFRRMLRVLYANTNISRREKLGSEMIRLIFAKIWDERYNPDKPPLFRIGLHDRPGDVKGRVQSLFREVKRELVGDGVFERHEEITLDPKSVMWVVGQLERYSLLRTDKDVVGDAFEVFAESKLVGEKGEFFTPREVVKTAIDLVDPQPEQTVLDPACGSGGFLIYALEHVWRAMETSPRYRGSPELPLLKQQIARRCFFGIDKEVDLVRIAKAYMAIVGDGRGGIVQQNSLHRPEEFEGRARRLFVEEDPGKGARFRKFDIVLTNPPFGSRNKVLKEAASSFALGHAWKRVSGGWVQTERARNTEPQILFVERCLDMLEDGGLLAIVLPETFFHATGSKHIINYIETGNNIKAVVDLAHNTFRPHNNAKTMLLVVQKGRPQQPQIVMAVTEQTGHDHQGKPIYRFDEQTRRFTEQIWDDTVIVREELRKPDDPENSNVFVINTDEIKDDIYVPRYYWPAFGQRLLARADTEGIEFVQMQQLLDDHILVAFPGHGSPPSQFKGRGPVPYIRVADIVNWELYKNPVTRLPRHVYLKKKGRGVDLEVGDIIFVRRGSYRIGTVAMVSPFDREVLLTKELVVMRVVKPHNRFGIDPYYLIYLLSHELTQQQMYQKVFIETTLPNIGDRWRELYLPVLTDREKAASVAQRIKSALDAKWAAQKQIQELRSELGGLTT